MPAKSLKAADKQTILKKLVVEMKRRYGGSIPKHSYTAFETLLFAACLEDSGYQAAEASYTRLLDGFFDLNEIRVSSVGEIEQALGQINESDWKAMRIREALQHIFEKHYAFDLEFLKRKTQDLAVKELEQFPHLSPFIQGYVIQHALGAHVIPVDTTILRLLIWLGLADLKATPDAAGEDLKSGVKKTEAPLLCYLLKCTATDPELVEHFQDIREDDDNDPFTAAQRLVDLFKNPKKMRKPEKKAPPAKTPPAAKHPVTPAKTPASAKPAAATKALPTGKAAPLAKAVAASKAAAVKPSAPAKAPVGKPAAAKAVSLKKPTKKGPPARSATQKTASTANRKVTKKVPAKKATRNRGK